MNSWEYLALFGSILISGASYFLFRKTHEWFLKLSLAFSGSFLFAICLTHLIPSVYANGGTSIGLYVLAGFFIQIILEYLSEGIEHGHVHVHIHPAYSFPLAMMIGLSVHSFLEGIPLSGSATTDEHSHRTLLTGIIMHHIPVAFALASMLSKSGVKKMSVIMYLCIFAAMAPLGAWSAQFAGAHFFTEMEVYFNRIMAIVIGIFLHISTTILFESNNTHRFNLYKLLVIAFGAAAALLMDVA